MTVNALSLSLNNQFSSLQVQRKHVKLSFLFYVMHVSMVISQFLKLLRLLKTSLQIMQFSFTRSIYLSVQRIHQLLTLWRWKQVHWIMMSPLFALYGLMVLDSTDVVWVLFFPLYCGLGLAFSLFFKTSGVICFRSWNWSTEQVSELGENDEVIYIFFFIRDIGETVLGSRN